MALALVNIDNPRQFHDLDVRAGAKRLADELGWTNFAVIEHTDPNVLASVLSGVPARPEADRPDPLGDITFASLVKDGYVYEVRVDDGNVTVHGRESSIACPRAVLDGE
jgi:hypothetical protein